jgi:cytoskeletal protein CcmA (bactofilin family)|tara:strand:+ start:1321 stop:1749 length:429 start_codon:yes stop_codon:yes gene_type:complete
MFNASQDSDESSYISETCHIEGEISSMGDVLIAGIIDGNIVSKKLIVLDTGTINGNIESPRVEVEGQINGNIQGNNIFLGRNALVKGDIYFYETLKTEEGADVDGYIKKSKNLSKNIQHEKENKLQKKFDKPTLVKDVDQAI